MTTEEREHSGSCDHDLRRAGTNGHGRRGDGRADQSPLQGEARELRRGGKAALENAVEELADVQIMLDQLRIIFGRSTAEIEEDKLRRLLRRINSYKESNIRKWLNSSFKPGDWWSRTVNTEAHPHEEGGPEK